MYARYEKPGNDGKQQTVGTESRVKRDFFGRELGEKNKYSADKYRETADGSEYYFVEQIDALLYAYGYKAYECRAESGDEYGQ